MSIKITSIKKMLQQLIDDAVDEVCAEYDECGSIQQRAIVPINDGESKTIKLDPVDSGPLPTILAEANSGLKEIGSGTLIIQVFEQARELVFILARCGDHTASCSLWLDSKTGVADNDVVLIDAFAFAPVSGAICLWMPTKWTGRVVTLQISDVAVMLAVKP